MQKKILALTLTALTLSACGVIDNNPIYGEKGIVRDRSQDYENAEQGKRLSVPSHLDARVTEDSLQIPQVSEVGSARVGDFEVPRPEFFYAESGSDAVNLKRVEGEKLIVVDEGITNVWVKLTEFWSFNGIQLSDTKPRQGLMETEWISNEAKEFGFVDTWIKRLTFQDIPGPTKDKLQVRLNPVVGASDRTSISMRHIRFAAEEQVSEVDWANQARDVSYKSDMMFEMLRYLSKATGERSAQSLVAFQEKHRGGTQLGRDSRGNPVLKIDAPIAQAWDLVSAALDKADLDVGTRDADVGYFYMTYTTSTPFEETEDLGFFEWLHSDRGPITFSTSALGEALGLSDGETDGISYSSGKTLARLQNTDPDAIDPLSDPNDKANQKGYKIWFGGKPIYVFGGGDDAGIYNQTTGQFEHTGLYQLKLTRTRSGAYLSVYTEEGVSAPAVVAEEILWDVKDGLSKQG
ncbi:outer membrane protein assembly factor BamC [Pontibacter sp. JAM-7]|uniref:outer membrane protein assembly factor BamC n=1 Tax=Pontibacter sp. JAM-7 TaxID=3366581 RepID=UPI003AF78BB0